MGVACGVILLDFVIYLQHVMFHFVPVFWRLHRVHHADLDFDFTTGGRFHPIEILLSMGIKMAAVATTGAPPLAFLLFEVLLNAVSMFNHGNVSLPPAVDGVLRFLVVTPDMHRVHHSVVPRETNSNFGFNLPWWDRILGTYRDQPAAGHDGMTIGLAQFQEEKRQTLPWMLVLPFRDGSGRRSTGYPER
jgi:sterol desaturase/sphingolipid hydroxylase (fatty acid hydroxylase superfamily)